VKFFAFCFLKLWLIYWRQEKAEKNEKGEIKQKEMKNIIILKNKDLKKKEKKVKPRNKRKENNKS